MVDVLLINPYVLTRHAGRRASHRPYPPLGLMYLGAVLREAGFSVEVYDGTFAEHPDDILEKLASGSGAKIAGIFAMNSFRDDALMTVKHLKNRGYTVFAGGPDPSIYDEEYLNAGVDIVVRGEGEVAILSLMAAFGMMPGANDKPERPSDETLLEISGLSITARSGTHQRAEDRGPSKSMDELPSPAYDLIDLDEYVSKWREVHGYASLQFMTSRGCPFSCSWCARPIFGRKYRQYSAERAADEIEHLIKRYGFEHLWLFDDTFVVRRQWVESFCDAIIDRKISVRWECLARVDLVDRELLRLMRDAGCERINFGFESGSQRVLDRMKKGTTVVDAKRVAKDMHELGITMGGYVLMGYPGEEWEDLEATISLVREIQPVDYSTSVVLPMPGTEFFTLVQDMMLKDSKWTEHDDESLIWESPYSRGFYRLVESLISTEYKLGLEFSVRSYVKRGLLRSLLFGMRKGISREYLDRYQSDRFKGWQGLRKPEHAARHRESHAHKAEDKRSQRVSKEKPSEPVGLRVIQ